MNILMVLTSNDRLGTSAERTGFWLEEVAAPYYRFLEAGASVTLASPRGGRSPVDPRSEAEEAQTDDTRRFAADEQAQAALSDTRPLDDVDLLEFDAVFYPGGHGPLWDLVEDAHSRALIGAMLGAGRPVGAVCHGPAALAHATMPDGTPVVKGRAVTGFSNSEEAAVGLADAVPLLIETVFREAGARYSKGEDFAPHVVADGPLVTGQNPASSSATAERLLEVLKETRKAA